MELDPERCCELVYDRYMYRNNQCSRKGSIERDGKLYCKQHDPVAVSKRMKEAQEQYEKKLAEERVNRVKYGVEHLFDVVAKTQELLDAQGLILDALANID